MRRALIVGIDHYEKVSHLYGCVNDAYSIKNALERNADGTVNFGVSLLTGTGSGMSVPRSVLKDHITALFKDDPEIALFYFAGHGHVENTGGFLLASDSSRGDEGVSLTEVLTLANKSRARNKVIVLDSCHSGAAGASTINEAVSELSEGMTILTASTAEQYATEENGEGVFTKLFANALNGAAADLLGNITPGSVYAHIDQSLGPWDQRPVFKTNVKNFVSLRQTKPSVELADLHLLPVLFPDPSHVYPLDPSYEPESENPDIKKNETFAVLQKFNRVNLLVPVGAPHMWHAAMESKGCKLTVLGEHYWRLVERGLI